MTYFEIHMRVLPEGTHMECIHKYSCNPSFEYEKHPLIQREVSMGFESLLKRNKDIPRENIKHFFFNDVLTFYIGERE